MRKILSIDGGGIKGIFSASFLAEIEEKCGGPYSEYFDMIAGTSTGAIIAAALSIGIPAQEILNLYLKKGKEIFPKGSTHFKLFHGKYSNEPLKNALIEVFGTKKIKDCQTRLLIPAFDLENRKVHIFKTPHSEDLYFDKECLLVDCLLATTAAPIYFSPYQMNGGIYMDGGIGANNPSMITVVEAMTRCGWKSDEIQLLSVGGVNELHPTTGAERMGLLDALKIQKSYMLAENQYAESVCKLFLKKENYIRITQDALKRQVSLDKVSEESSKALRDWGINKAQENIQIVNTLFFEKEKEDVFFYNIER